MLCKRVQNWHYIWSTVYKTYIERMYSHVSRERLQKLKVESAIWVPCLKLKWLCCNKRWYLLIGLYCYICWWNIRRKTIATVWLCVPDSVHESACVISLTVLCVQSFPQWMNKCAQVLRHFLTKDLLPYMAAKWRWQTEHEEKKKWRKRDTCLSLHLGAIDS